MSDRDGEIETGGAGSSAATAFGASYFEGRRPNGYQRIFGLKGFVTRWLRKQLPRDASLLDVGCGTGLYLEELSWVPERFGCDVSEWALEVAARAVPAAAFAPVEADGPLPFGDRCFDAISAFDVIEHVPDDERFIAELRSRLRPGGILVLSTPNPASVGRRLKGSAWFGYRDETHINLREPAHFVSLLERHGFAIERVAYDGLWDVPYFTPWAALERPFIQVPSVLAFNFAPFRWAALGENLWLIARAPAAATRAPSEGFAAAD